MHYLVWTGLGLFILGTVLIYYGQNLTSKKTQREISEIVSEKNDEIEKIVNQNKELKEEIEGLSSKQIKLIKTSNQLVKTSNEQIEKSIEQISKIDDQTRFANSPILRIEPDRIKLLSDRSKAIKSDVAKKFEITISNYGVNNIVDINIFLDVYYTNLNLNSNPDRDIIRIGKEVKLGHPYKKMSTINANKSKNLTIDITKEYLEFNKIKQESIDKNSFMMLVRFQITFKRIIDMKKYEYVKPYIVWDTPKGTQLVIIHDDRGMSMLGDWNFGALRKMLGATEE